MSAVRPVPDNWQLAPVGDLCNLINGRGFKKSEWEQAGLPIIRIQNLKNSSSGFNYFAGSYDDRILIEPGELLFSWSGTPGTSFGAFTWDGPTGVLNQHIFRVVFDGENLDRDFFRFALTERLDELIGGAQGGVGLRHVTKGKLEKTELLLPPLNEQRRIVSKIESLESHREAAQEALEAIPPLLEKFRQSVLAAAFRGDLTREWRAQNPDVEPASVLLERIRTERKARFIEDAAETARAKAEAKARDAGKPWGDADDQKVREKERAKAEKKYKEPEPVDATGLPELPEGWCWATVKELATHRSGVAFKSGDFLDEGVQVVRLGNLYRGNFDLNRAPVFVDRSSPVLTGGRLRSGDLIVSQTGTRHKRDYGFFVQVPPGKELALNQRLLSVSVASCIPADWILRATKTRWYLDHFFSHETGGVNQGNVGIDGVMNGPIPIAPVAEISLLTSLLDRVFDFENSIAKAYGEAASQFASLSNSILAKAFRGELVPQDPNDEPASVLLERIRAERAEADAQAKPKKKAARKTTKKAAKKKSGAKASS